MEKNTSDSRPVISVVMPLYNKEGEVLASIFSVQRQSITDWELIVVDDGSNDRGPEQVAELDDKRIRLVRQKNAGVAVARNRGIELARTELIAFLDADDIWKPGFLACIFALMQDYPEAQWFATGYEKQDNEGNVYGVRLSGLPSGFQRGIFPSYFSIAAQSDPPVWTSAMAVKREAIMAVGGFPVGVKSGEDLLTWARLALRFPLAYDINHQSVFQVSGLERKPDVDQYVTYAFSSLLKSNPSAEGLRAYLGLWCRMQAVMALKFNDVSLARQSAWASFKYEPFQWRNAYTLFLAWLPSQLRQTLDSYLRRLAKA